MDKLYDLPPVILQGAYVTGLFAVLAAIIARSVAAGALRVQQQTLFTTLLPRRVEWSDSFRQAVEAWDHQMAHQVHWKGAGAPPSRNESFKAKKSATDARWLFDNTVSYEAQRIMRQLEVVHQLRQTAAAGGTGVADVAQQIGDAVFEVYDLFTPLTDALKPFLYVGNIKQPPKIVNKVIRVKHVNRTGAGRLNK